MSIPSRRDALFIVTAIALAGATFLQSAGLVINYFFADQLPDTDLFHGVFFYLYLPGAILTAWCGLAVGYVALRSGRLPPIHLIAFGALLCPFFTVDHVTLGWSALRSGYGLRVAGIGVGLNLVGLAFLSWLGLLLGAQPRSRGPACQRHRNSTVPATERGPASACSCQRADR